MDGDGDGVGLLLRAADFAAKKHKNQRRKDHDSTPYINHCIGVAAILSKEGHVRDPQVLAAALLHDTVEDTQTTFDELTENFGQEIMQIVKECTDDKSLDKMERKRLQIEHAAHASNKAKLVKLGDKIYNLRDLQTQIPKEWTPERVAEYFDWAKKVTDGCRGVNNHLDAALDHIYQQGPVL